MLIFIQGQYTLRGFKIDEKELPGELPNGEYRADFQASMKINDHDFPVYTDRYYFTNSQCNFFSIFINKSTISIPGFAYYKKEGVQQTQNQTSKTYLNSW